MEFSGQGYWSVLPFPSPGDLLDPGIEPWSPALWADSLPFDPPGNPNTMYKSRLLCVVGQSGGQAAAELMRSSHATCHQDRTQTPRTDGRAPAKTYLLGTPLLPVRLPSYHHGKHTTHTQTHTHCRPDTNVKFTRPDAPSFFFKIYFYLDHF